MKGFEQEIFILHSNLSEKIPNSETIATQVGPDSENSENDIANIIQYTVECHLIQYTVVCHLT